MFFALGGDPKLGFPFFVFLGWGFARGDPTWGLSVPFGFLLRLFSVGVFVRLSGAEKRDFSPLTEGRVCAEWQNTLPPYNCRGQEHHGKSPANEDTCHRW